MTEPERLELITRLMNYHDQVLIGFRHISRLEEAELIQAAIEALRPPLSGPVDASGEPLATLKAIAARLHKQWDDAPSADDALRECWAALPPSSPVADSPTEQACIGCTKTGPLVGYTFEHQPGPLCRACWEALKASVRTLDAETPETKRIELIICARCGQEIKDGGLCGYTCDLDGELRDAREPADVISERYVLASSRKWSAPSPSAAANKETKG